MYPMRELAAFVFTLALVVGCGGRNTERTDKGMGSSPPPAAPETPAAPHLKPALEPGGTMPSTTPGQALPTPFDARVTWVLESALPEDVVIEFSLVSMGKLPYGNYRWRLHRDGRLFYQQHTRKPGDWQVPFDQAWPGKSALRLDANEIAALVDKLESAGFFRHAGYQADPNVDDGAFYIVRARDDSVNTVVYQNITPAPIPDLTRLSDPLWKD
jgi:hypothetical protein